MYTVWYSEKNGWYFFIMALVLRDMHAQNNQCGNQKYKIYTPARIRERCLLLEM